MNSDKETKASWKIAYLIFQYFMYIHILGCLWYFVVSEDELWIPNTDFIWFGNTQIYDYYSRPWSRSYIYSVFIAFYLLNVSEVCPKTQTEFTVAIMVMVVSSIANGIIIGNMALYMVELNKKNADFQRKMDTVGTAMRNI